MFVDLFGPLQTECGYTPDEIRAMTLDDVQRLYKHWEKHPPLRALVASVAHSLGVKLPQSDQPNKALHMNADEARALLEMTGGKIPGIGSA